MAHFVELDENNIVKQVIVVANNELLIDEIESEAKGIIFCKSLFGEDTKWKQTSYNGNIRKNYAGIGDTYDEDKDAFIPPKPFKSWVLNENICQWEPPIPYPVDEKLYIWDEPTVSWLEINNI
jgi:hypothetical protein